MRATFVPSAPRRVLQTVDVPTGPRSPLMLATGLLVLLTLGLTLDAMLHPLAPFDWSVLHAVQRIDLPWLAPSIHLVDTLTDSTWAPVIWAAVLTILLIIRWWSAALVTFLMPIGGVINHLIGVVLVHRSRPDESDALRTIGDWGAPSFPSGHVLGAVMLYGFLLCLVPRVRHRLVRLSLVTIAVGVLGLVGFGRIWLGAHWPSDVLAAYTLGAVFVVWQHRAVQILDAAWRGTTEPAQCVGTVTVTPVLAGPGSGEQAEEMKL